MSEMSEAGHTQGRTAFTAHCHAAACPLPGSPDRRSLGMKVSGWGLAPTRGWRVLSCRPPVVPALLLSLFVILGFYEPLDILIFPVSASMSGVCHWQARAPVGHSSLPGLLEALLAGGGAPRAEDPRVWGVPALRSPGLGQTSFWGHSAGFPAVGIVSMFGSFRSLQTQESWMLGRLCLPHGAVLSPPSAVRGPFTGASSGGLRLFIACGHSTGPLERCLTASASPSRSSQVAPAFL